jgi:hypothetical protein
VKISSEHRGMRVRLNPSFRHGTILHPRPDDKDALIILDSGEVLNLNEDQFQLGDQGLAIPAAAVRHMVTMATGWDFSSLNNVDCWHSEDRRDIPERDTVGAWLAIKRAIEVLQSKCEIALIDAKAVMYGYDGCKRLVDEHESKEKELEAENIRLKQDLQSLQEYAKTTEKKRLKSKRKSKWKKRTRSK